MSKKEAILEAASRVIREQGVKNLTLDAVAVEAGLSKGGLIHHFPTKDALITAMNRQVVTRFRYTLEKEVEATGSYVKGYVLATINELEEDFLNIHTSLLAAIANQPTLLAPWVEEYEQFKKRLEEENIAPEQAMLARLVCDGLWFSRIFDLAQLSEKEQQQLLHYLFQIIDDESQEAREV